MPFHALRRFDLLKESNGVVRELIECCYLMIPRRSQVVGGYCVNINYVGLVSQSDLIRLLHMHFTKGNC